MVKTGSLESCGQLIRTAHELPYLKTSHVSINAADVSVVSMPCLPQFFSKSNFQHHTWAVLLGICASWCARQTLLLPACSSALAPQLCRLKLAVTHFACMRLPVSVRA